jgi:hypothetical protein
MKISSFKKIVPEDFTSETRELVRKLASLLNPYLEDLYKTTANSITIGENLKNKKVRISLVEGEATGVFSWTLNEKPTCCLVGQITTDNNLISQAYSLSWILTYTAEKGYQVSWQLFGLDAAKKHELTISALVS